MFTLSEDDFYNENRSIQWNYENKKHYQIIYTSNYDLVVLITPINVGKKYTIQL